MLLEIRDLHVYYGHIHAVKGVSLHVRQGEIVTLLGANGAGKSTTLLAIAGVVPPQQGKILLKGDEVTHARTDQIARLGMNLVPEGRHIFPDFTVDENLRIGSYRLHDPSRVATLRERVYTLFPHLKERLSQPGGTLSGGEQQMLAIARGLMADPAILLLDEPSLGLAPALTEVIFEHIREIRRQGTTVLLVEQNAQSALQIADRGYVMETGNMLLEGPSRELLDTDVVRRAYLGIGIDEGTS
jgi:branched-chain amino acid transport system ATP-binding protein